MHGTPRRFIYGRRLFHLYLSQNNITCIDIETHVPFLGIYLNITPIDCTKFNSMKSTKNTNIRYDTR